MSLSKAEDITRILQSEASKEAAKRGDAFIVPRNPVENYIQRPYVRSADIYDAIKYLLQHRPRRDHITKVVNLKLDLRVPNGKDIPVEEFLEILFEILSNRLPEGVEVCLETISGEDYT